MARKITCNCGKCDKCLHRNWRKVQDQRKRNADIRQLLYEQNAISASSSLNPHIVHSFRGSVPTYFKTNSRIGYVLRDENSGW